MVVIGFYVLFAVTFVTLCRLIAPADGWRARALEIGTPLAAAILCGALAAHFKDPSLAMAAATAFALTAVSGFMRPYANSIRPAFLGNSEGARVAFYAGSVVLAMALTVSAATGIDFFKLTQ